MTLALVNNKYYIQSLKPLRFTYSKDKAYQFLMPDRSYILSSLYDGLKYALKEHITLDLIDYTPGVIMTLSDIASLLNIDESQIYLKNIPKDKLL